MDSWRTTPFQMYEGGPVWVPPPLFALEADKLAAIDPKSELAIGREKLLAKLPAHLRESLEQILKNLTLERNSIKEAMGFALDHADMSLEVQIFWIPYLFHR